VNTHRVPELARIIAEVAERLLADGRRLVTAESCTGGWVAKACTDLPGSSRWYRGGVVVYADDLKVALLGVRPDAIAANGAVSEAVVREMAAGALQRLGGDVAVAVTGIAGPAGGSADKPVGTVWFGWARRTEVGIEVRAAGEQFDGDRSVLETSQSVHAWAELKPYGF
jgi:nicotinamide-nucleotide amidase